MFIEYPPSTSSLLLTTEVHLIVFVKYSGDVQTTDDVSGSSPGLIAAPRLFQILSAYTDSLLRGLACHVTRASTLLIVWLSIPCSQVTTPLTQLAYVCPAGTWNVLEIGLFTVNARPDTKYHSLSLAIGPPSVASRSRYRPI